MQMMRSVYLTNFMQQQGTSLGGRFKTNYETLSDPARWEMENDVWGWRDELSGEFMTQSGMDFFTVSGSGTYPTVVMRAIGMYLVGQMPEDGLIETLSTLQDIFEFHVNIPYQSWPTPQLEKVNARITAGLPEAK